MKPTTILAGLAGAVVMLIGTAAAQSFSRADMQNLARFAELAEEHQDDFSAEGQAAVESASEDIMGDMMMGGLIEDGEIVIHRKMAEVFKTAAPANDRALFTRLVKDAGFSDVDRWALVSDRVMAAGMAGNEEMFEGLEEAKAQMNGPMGGMMAQMAPMIEAMMSLKEKTPAADIAAYQANKDVLPESLRME